jgi:RNA 2',3'-cyclic 3'-phosphodiesterase
MARIRTFIAVEIEAGTRQKVAALQRTLSQKADGIKWVAPESLHVTLVFLGEVDDRDLIGIHRILGKVAAVESPFLMSFQGLSAFPNPRRPKVLWSAANEGHDELLRLHAALEAPLLDLGGYRQEERAFTPHLTLGRTSTDEESATVALEIPKHATWTSGQTSVEELVLYASELRRNGPEYTVLARAPLGGS